MSEIRKSLENYEMNFLIEIFTKDMIKEDNIECCVCLDFHWGVKLNNCNHFICPTCYYKMYYGYISHTFYNNNTPPEHPKKPTYPYSNISQNLEIYNTLTDNITFMDWFINDNEDLYNSIKIKSEFVDNIDINIIKWFENEFIVKYENDLLEYELNNKKYNDEMNIYCNLIKQEKENNIRKMCPLCRL